MKRHIAPIISIGCSLGAIYANAQTVEYGEHTKYYEIYGSSVGQLSEQMVRRGPPANSGTRHAVAQTVTTFSTRYSKDGDAQACRVVAVAMLVDVEYTMPLWRERKFASKKLIDYWDHFYAKLARHEKQHGELDRVTGKRMAEMLRSIDRNLPCEEYKYNASKIIKEIMKTDRTQRDFDRAARQNHDRPKFTRGGFRAFRQAGK